MAADAAESDTRPANFGAGSSTRRLLRSSSHEATTLPRRHLGDVGQVEIVLVMLGIA